MAANAAVTFHYDSGAFTSSPRAASPRFGTHLTADLTFSSDFNYAIRPLQHLGDIATFLDWSVTSGEFTLNRTNATITVDITDYFSTFFTNPLVQITFHAAGNVGGVPLTIDGSPSINITDGIGVNPDIRCGPYNQICGTNFRNFNLGGGTFTKTFGDVGGGGGGGGGGGNAPVPEPATWALMLAGFGLVGIALRRRDQVRVSFA
jgi:hypothetical protein